MSVYIKGMEMPKGCTFCKISRRNGKKMVCPLCFGRGEWDIRDPMSADHRLDDCPLIPVPDHGRENINGLECFMCSCCGDCANQPWGIDGAIMFSYCPNCGAKMELEGGNT